MKDKRLGNWLMQPASWVVAGLLILAGCQSNTTTKAETKAAEKPVAAVPAPAAATGGVGPPFVGYHRYRGTVGGQPVTVALTINEESTKPSLLVCEGSYRYDRHPGGQLLLRTSQPYLPHQPLLLGEADREQPQQTTGRWQTTRAAGPLLVGTWTSPVGQQLPFSLHEDYTDGQGHLMAVRYELFTEGVTGARCRPEREENETNAEYRQRLKDQPAASFDRQYLRLLGYAATQPALRHLQCPPPRQRHAALQAALKEAGDCVSNTDGLSVTYNDYGLLVLLHYGEEYYQGTPHANHRVDLTAYDLRTGEALTLADLLKPGTEHALRQLVTRELRHEMELDASEVLHQADGDSTTTELPRAGVGLSAEGLIFQYTDYELGSYAYGQPSITIPWRELLPLLRPNSPVARMLRERGLWATSQKQ